MKILILGDKAHDAKALHDVFKKEASFLSRVLLPGAGVLGEIRKFGPDVLILNPEGPLNGMMDVYRALKQDETLADVPVVVVAGEEELRRGNLPQGVEEVFCRPIRGAECVARVQLLYKKTHHLTDKNVIRAGKLEIDVSKYEVRVAGMKVDLTYTEYELLKFLAGHPDQVFTRDVLLNKVWGYEYYGGARTVDVHVRRLRSKIELKSQHFIETVRNIGYKFMLPEDD